jgi:predicted nucleic acid-binding protein
VTRILDAHALMAFLEREPGYEIVKSFFVSAVEKDEPLLMTTVNYGEVYYIILRECGRDKIEHIDNTIRTLPIEFVDADVQLAREAARFKAVKKMSYADCFAAALAKIRKGEVVTGDREFRAVESEVRISWIRS